MQTKLLQRVWTAIFTHHRSFLPWKKGKRDRSFLMRRVLGSWHLCSSAWPIWGKTLWAMWSFANDPPKDDIKFSAAKWKQPDNIYSKPVSFGKKIWCSFISISLYYLREEVWNSQTVVDSWSGSCRRQGFKTSSFFTSSFWHIKEDAEVPVAVKVRLCYGDVYLEMSWSGTFGLLGKGITVCCCYHQMCSFPTWEHMAKGGMFDFFISSVQIILTQ